MAHNPQFEGSWDPSTGAFPIVPNGVSCAYYLVTEPGRINNISYAEGDWLIYLEEEGHPAGTGSWYRTSGGIIQLATTTQNFALVTADIVDFSAATQAAILVDNTTIVKDPTTGVLHVIAGTGSSSPPITNVIEEEDPTYVAPHHHVGADIDDFVHAVRESLGPTAANTPFFSNTALSNAVVFTFNNTLDTVSADVKIDNSTIVKNKYGQLVAGKPQPMAISDILGLDEYLDNYYSNNADPTQWVLEATAPTNGTWSPPGAHDFTGVKFGDALYLVNVDIATIEAELHAAYQGTIPFPPPALSPSIIPVLDPSITFFEAYQAGTGNVIGVTLNRLPPTLPTAPFFKGLAAAPAGTLTAFIDTMSAGAIHPLDPSIDQTGITAGALVITEDVDSYLSEPAFHDIFKSIRAKIAPDVPLTAGHHSYYLQELLPGTGSLNSGTVTVDIDIPAVTMHIASSTQFSPTPASHYISGVLALDPTIEYTLAPITAQGVVGYTYGQYVVNVSGQNTLIDTAGDLPAASVPIAPDYAHGHYGDAITAPFNFHIQDTYNESAALNIAPYNSAGTLGPVLVFPLGRVDGTIETNRVYSGDPTTTYPTDHGTTWDSSQSLVGSTYHGELQKLNQKYQWPIGNYPNGPNYSSAAGIVVSGQTGSWRWVTLQLATGVIGNVAFTLSFLDGNTSSWTCNPYTRQTDGILIYAKLGDSGWVDCNSPYRGIGTSDTNGAAAMDASGHEGYETTASVKRVTLGPSIANTSPGNLYVRVALPLGSTKQFSDIVVSDWA
jgi:hypothetical protein